MCIHYTAILHHHHSWRSHVFCYQFHFWISAFPLSLSIPQSLSLSIFCASRSRITKRNPLFPVFVFCWVLFIAIPHSLNCHVYSENVQHFSTNCNCIQFVFDTFERISDALRGIEFRIFDIEWDFFSGWISDDISIIGQNQHIHEFLMNTLDAISHIELDAVLSTLNAW